MRMKILENAKNEGWLKIICYKVWGRQYFENVFMSEGCSSDKPVAYWVVKFYETKCQKWSMYLLFIEINKIIYPRKQKL